MSAAIAAEVPEIVVLGTLPPPVTGMTALTERVVRRLESAGPVVLFDWSSGLSRKGFKFRVARMFRVLRSFIGLLRRGRRNGARMYLVANSSWGLYLTVLFAIWGRRLGYHVYLHHHVYSYIDRRDWRMAWIDRRMGRTGVHVVHCNKMIDDFRRQYDSPCGFALICPGIVSGQLGRARVSAMRPFRLGHLSNLTIEKGLDLVIETFESVLQAGLDVRLELAGPVQRGPARRVLERALSTHPDRVNYHGPVYGDDKAKFFAEIDAFVFPTRYRNESWGIVLQEAMAAAVPVITYDRGCTQTVVGARGGVVIDSGTEFTAIAAAHLERWINDADEYRAASQGAIEQAAHLQDEGERDLDAFAAHMFADAETSISQ
jgi:glycosyltransferase involved in cell wall biosynthesis